MNPFGFATHESPYDDKRVYHSDLTQAGVPLVKGGYDYFPFEIFNQSKEGICTGISHIQNRNKADSRLYSADFQYLLQKKFIDKNWIEGSSILASLKVGNKYGFLPAELWTWTVQQDRDLPYADYIAKLQAIPDVEVTRLLNLCVNKIAGYAQVDITDSQAIARAIDQSDSGILCRYEVGQEWFTDKNGNSSWFPKDIDPLRNPLNPISGHAIIASRFHFLDITQQDYDDLKNGIISVRDLEKKYPND